MPKVYCKRLVEGITVPAIIHNMHYYYISMPLFEDGSMDCWERISLDALEAKLAKGWLVTSVPAGQSLGIHNLGSYTIRHARWQHTPETYAAYIYECVRRMNREMTGLFAETAEQKQKWADHRVSWGTHAKPYKLKGDLGYDMQDGESVKLFYKSQNGWTPTALTAYADGSLVLDAAAGELVMEDVETMFAAGDLSSCIEGEFELSIPNMGLLTVTGNYQTESPEKLKEIKDALDRISGGQTSLEICRRRYHEYLVDPTEANRERLRGAYDAVPEHQRMFLGDMDMKDADYVRILYYPHEKREV